MGVFTIRSRSERLGNISSPGVRKVNMPNYRIGSGSAEAWRAGIQLGRDIMHAGSSMARIAGDMIRERDMIQDTETETAFVDAMRAKMETPETGLLGRVRTAGDSKTLQDCITEGQDYFKSAAEDILKDKGYSGDRKKKMLFRLKDAASPFERAMMQGVLGKTQELKVSAADKNFNSLLETWHAHKSDDNATKSVVDAYRASQRVRGLADDSVDINTDKIVRSMAYDYLAECVNGSSREQLDHLEKKLGEGDKAEFFPFHQQFSEYFNGKDPLAHTVATSSGAGISARDGLKTVIATRRRKLDELDQQRIAAIVAPGVEAANTIWDPKNPTARNPERLEGTESAINALKAELDAKDSKGGKRLRDGSAARSIAVRDLANLEQSADAIAGEELMLGLVEEYRKDPKNPPKIWIEEERDADGKIVKEARPVDELLKNSRKARLAQQIQAQFDQSIAPVKTARHTDTVAALRLAMLDGAANRGEYHKKLYNAAMAQDISLAEWEALRTEFDETWTKGSNGNISEKQKFAKKALATIQDVFGGAVTEAFTYNPKTGRLDQVKDSDYEGLSFEVADRYGFWSWKNWLSGGGEFTWTTTHRLSAADVGELATLAGELSRYDGEILTEDPITGSTEKTYFGEKIDPSKAQKFNAAAYFEKLVKKMRNDIWVKENVDYVYDLTLAAQRLQNQDRSRATEELKRIQQSAQAEPKDKKNAIIKKPNTKNIGVAPKK